MNILSNISERLKDLMSEKDLNITELSAKTHIDRAVISRLLKAERMPSTATLVILADYFECTADYILGMTEHYDERTFKTRPPFDKQFDFLLKHFGITKYALEKQTGLPEETVNRWHRGKYEPSVENIVRLAEFFDCSVDFILGREA